MADNNRWNYNYTGTRPTPLNDRAGQGYTSYTDIENYAPQSTHSQNTNQGQTGKGYKDRNPYYEFLSERDKKYWRDGQNRRKQFDTYYDKYLGNDPQYASNEKKWLAEYISFIESKWVPSAENKDTHAKGLFQIMPQYWGTRNHTNIQDQFLRYKEMMNANDKAIIKLMKSGRVSKSSIAMSRLQNGYDANAMRAIAWLSGTGGLEAFLFKGQNRSDGASTQSSYAAPIVARNLARKPQSSNQQASFISYGEDEDSEEPGNYTDYDYGDYGDYSYPSTGDYYDDPGEYAPPENFNFDNYRAQTEGQDQQEEEPYSPLQEYQEPRQPQESLFAEDTPDYTDIDYDEEPQDFQGYMAAMQRKKAQQQALQEQEEAELYNELYQPTALNRYVQELMESPGYEQYINVSAPKKQEAGLGGNLYWDGSSLLQRAREKVKSLKYQLLDKATPSNGKWHHFNDNSLPIPSTSASDFPIVYYRHPDNDIEYDTYSSWEDAIDDAEYRKKYNQTALNLLDEVPVQGYRPIKLVTYYPGDRQFPYTGHSAMEIPITDNVRDYYGYDNGLDWNNDTHLSLLINKSSNADDYNLVTNNCADATLSFLEAMYGKKASPWLFTTPGDVRDFAVEKLGGKHIYNNGLDTVFLPRNKDNAENLSERAMQKFFNMYRKRTGTVAPITSHSGVVSDEFSNGGHLFDDGGGFTDFWSQVSNSTEGLPWHPLPEPEPQPTLFSPSVYYGGNIVDKAKAYNDALRVHNYVTGRGNREWPLGEDWFQAGQQWPKEGDIVNYNGIDAKFVGWQEDQGDGWGRRPIIELPNGERITYIPTRQMPGVEVKGNLKTAADDLDKVMLGTIAAPIIAGAAAEGLPVLGAALKSEIGNAIGSMIYHPEWWGNAAARTVASMLGGLGWDALNRGITGHSHGENMQDLINQATGWKAPLWLTDMTNPGYFLEGPVYNGMTKGLTAATDYTLNTLYNNPQYRAWAVSRALNKDIATNTPVWGSMPNLDFSGIKGTQYYMDLVNTYGQETADRFVNEMSTPEFARYFVGDDIGKASREIDRYSRARKTIRQLNDAGASITGSSIIGNVGTIRRNSLFHDIDSSAYARGANHQWVDPNDEEAIAKAIKDLTAEDIEQSATIKALQDGSKQGAKVIEYPTIPNYLWGPHKIFQRLLNKGTRAYYDITDPEMLNFYAWPWFTNIDGSVNRTVQTQMNGIPVDIFFTKGKISEGVMDGTQSIEAPFYAKRKWMKMREKDAKDIADFKPYSEENKMLNPETGETQYAPLYFGPSLLTEEGFPAVQMMETYPGSGVRVPVTMNWQGKYRILGRPSGTQAEAAADSTTGTALDTSINSSMDSAIDNTVLNNTTSALSPTDPQVLNLLKSLHEGTLYKEWPIYKGLVEHSGRFTPQEPTHFNILGQEGDVVGELNPSSFNTDITYPYMDYVMQERFPYSFGKAVYDTRGDDWEIRDGLSLLKEQALDKAKLYVSDQANTVGGFRPTDTGVPYVRLREDSSPSRLSSVYIHEVQGHGTQDTVNALSGETAQKEYEAVTDALENSGLPLRSKDSTKWTDARSTILEIRGKLMKKHWADDNDPILSSRKLTKEDVDALRQEFDGLDIETLQQLLRETNKYGQDYADLLDQNPELLDTFKFLLSKGLSIGAPIGIGAEALSSAEDNQGTQHALGSNLFFRGGPEKWPVLQNLNYKNVLPELQVLGTKQQ